MSSAGLAKRYNARQKQNGTKRRMIIRFRDAAQGRIDGDLDVIACHLVARHAASSSVWALS